MLARHILPWTPPIPGELHGLIQQMARDNLTSGGAVDLTRGIQAWSARLMRSLQYWWGQAVSSRRQERPQRATVPIALLSETVLVPTARSVDTGHSIRVAERSPPAMGPPHTTMIPAPPPEPPSWTRS